MGTRGLKPCFIMGAALGGAADPVARHIDFANVICTPGRPAAHSSTPGRPVAHSSAADDPAAIDDVATSAEWLKATAKLRGDLILEAAAEGLAKAAASTDDISTLRALQTHVSEIVKLSTKNLSAAVDELNAVHLRQLACAHAGRVPSEEQQRTAEASSTPQVAAQSRLHDAAANDALAVRGPLPLPPPRCTPIVARPHDDAAATTVSTVAPAPATSPCDLATPAPPSPLVGDVALDSGGGRGAESCGSDGVRRYLARRKEQIRAQQRSAAATTRRARGGESPTLALRERDGNALVASAASDDVDQEVTKLRAALVYEKQCGRRC